MWTDKRIILTLLGWTYGGNVSVRLEASEVEAYEDEGSETGPDLGSGRFPYLAGYYYLGTGTGTLLRNVSKPTASWFRLSSYFRKTDKKQNCYGDSAWVVQLRIRDHLTSRHLNDLGRNQTPGVVFHCHQQTNRVKLTQTIRRTSFIKTSWKMQAESIVFW